MSDVDHRITHEMRDRIQDLLVAGGVRQAAALDEANSLCDGLGYYHRVTASTGLRFQQAYHGIEVVGGSGDVIELIPYQRVVNDDWD